MSKTGVLLTENIEFHCFREIDGIVLRHASLSFSVDFGDEVTNFRLHGLAMFELAHTLTILKAQGSEDGKVIVLIIWDFQGILTCDLTYTVISRANHRLMAINYT